LTKVAALRLGGSKVETGRSHFLIISENKAAAALGEGEDGMVFAVLGAVNASRF